MNRKRVLAEHSHLTLTGLYNVLEKLRAGIAPEALEPADRLIYDDGLVLILKETHDRLDAAVATAYGWPLNLSEDDLLARLVALNKERANEETRGVVRWLRAAYQAPKFGAVGDETELGLAGGATAPKREAASAAQKPLFPTIDFAQTAAVMSCLANAASALDAAAIAATFRQGRRIVGKVEAVVAALARMASLLP